jgi:hypothetical protein
MIDIISLSIAIGAVLVGILSHIRHSECFGVKIDTRTPKDSPSTTPLLQKSELPSEPINIPPRPKIKKNYL